MLGKIIPFATWFSTISLTVLAIPRGVLRGPLKFMILNASVPQSVCGSGCLTDAKPLEEC